MFNHVLTEFEKDRFNRHLLIEGFSEEHQVLLKKAKVLVIGAGGLGSPVILYLSAAGIGQIGIVDFDSVSVSNLNRQILFSDVDAGKSKAELAGEAAKKMNQECETVVYHEKWEDPIRAEQLIRDHDILVDCTDNVKSRLLSDEVSKKSGKPLVFGAIHEMEGQVAVFNLHGSCGYDRLAAKVSEHKSSVGVLGPLPGIVGSIQAAEVIKILTGVGEVLSDKLLVISLKYNRYNILDL